MDNTLKTVRHKQGWLRQRVSVRCFLMAAVKLKNMHLKLFVCVFFALVFFGED